MSPPPPARVRSHRTLLASIVYRRSHFWRRDKKKSINFPTFSIKFHRKRHEEMVTGGKEACIVPIASSILFTLVADLDAVRLIESGDHLKLCLAHIMLSIYF